MDASAHRSPSTARRYGIRRLIRFITRPDRLTGRRGGPMIRAYRGYGNASEIFLMGRVLVQPVMGGGLVSNGIWYDLMSIVRRFLQHGVPGAHVRARFAGIEKIVVADRLGYFRIRMSNPGCDDSRDGWHGVDLVLEDTEADVHARAFIFIPPKACRFVVISDIDDTVMYTGVANKLKMLWRLFATDAESRLAFPGAGAFYRALHGGATGSERNAMVYVSRAPWSIYDVLDAFFQLHQIPIGPILFLREWGVTLQHPLPKRARHHKREIIEEILSVYDDLPFVLIGDSGQRDPEIYSRVVREHRAQVLAVYIRNVSRKPARIREIDALATEVAKAGSGLVLAGDSWAMASHAADHGLIPPDALGAVEEEQRSGGEIPDRRPPQRVPADARSVGETAEESTVIE